MSTASSEGGASKGVGFIESINHALDKIDSNPVVKGLDNLVKTSGLEGAAGLAKPVIESVMETTVVSKGVKFDGATKAAPSAGHGNH